MDPDLITPKDVDDWRFTGKGRIREWYDALEVEEFMRKARHTIDSLTTSKTSRPRIRSRFSKKGGQNAH